MRRPITSPFSTLRSSRGLWFVCLVALLFKLTAGSLCLADRAVSDPRAAALTAQTVSDQADSASSLDAADGCVLGEGAGCHCDCGHAAPLPPVSPVHRSPVFAAALLRPEHAAPFQSAPRTAPHRPPIA